MTTPARRTRVRPGTTATTGRRPGASRPAPAPRTREATPDDDRRGPAWLRWVILGAIAVVLLVTLVPTARSLARQRAEIDALATQVAQQQSQVASLQAEQERWTDPAYVEQQARDRLKFVKVGDRSYTVIDPLEAARPPVSGASDHSCVCSSGVSARSVLIGRTLPRCGSGSTPGRRPHPCAPGP